MAADLGFQCGITMSGKLEPVRCTLCANDPSPRDTAVWSLYQLAVSVTLAAAGLF